ncbi:GGDEF domain-containing protein [Lysobacter olei]
MSDATRLFRKLGAALLARPDEMMLEIGASGELLVARIRVVVAGLLLLLPLVDNLMGSTVAETLLGLTGAVLFNAVALAWLALARRRRRYRWLPFATTTFDVTATSALLVLLAINHLAAGLNSMVVWCGYVLAILVTALRNDGRTTLLAGALAVGQYGLLVVLAFLVAGSPELLMSAEYGAVTVGNQMQRLVLLAFVTAVTTMLVYRMQRLVEMSGTDGLTRLPNRTWLMHRVPQLLDVVKREGGSLSVAMLDLDHFKRINDELGQHAGDRALRHVVASLRGQLEGGEQLVRVSGAEFVMVLRKPVGTAWERVDAIRRILAEHPFEPERGDQPRPITFSAGIAGFPQDGQDLSHLLRRADKRLQTAKLEGRNRVVARDG